jgi:hypothetical protein
MSLIINEAVISPSCYFGIKHEIFIAFYNAADSEKFQKKLKGIKGERP